MVAPHKTPLDSSNLQNTVPVQLRLLTLIKVELTLVKNSRTLLTLVARNGSISRDS